MKVIDSSRNLHISHPFRLYIHDEYKVGQKSATGPSIKYSTNHSLIRLFNQLVNQWTKQLSKIPLSYYSSTGQIKKPTVKINN